MADDPHKNLPEKTEQFVKAWFFPVILILEALKLLWLWTRN